MTSGSTPAQGCCLTRSALLARGGSIAWESQDIWLGRDPSPSFIWCVLDVQNRPVNVLNDSLLVQAHQALDQLLALQPKLLLFTSGKPNSFVAGADLDQLYPNLSLESARQTSEHGQKWFSRLSALPFPTVAVINGACLGGGLELALACTARVARNSAPSYPLGLPEVQLGLLPGAGGTVRLPQTIGVQAALPLILSGRSVSPTKAQALGLVQALFPGHEPDQFYGTVVQWAKKQSLRATSPYHHWSLRDWVLRKTWPGRRLVAAQSASELDRRSNAQYPAPYLALDAVVYGLAQRDVTAALRREAERFAQLAVSPEHKALTALFYAMERAKKPSGSQRKGVPLQKIAVLGCGVMGRQIAQLALKKGLHVFVFDIHGPALETLQKSITKPDEQARLTIGNDLNPLTSCDVVVEAAMEALDLKLELLQRVEAVVPASCVIASNTSSLSISALAKGLARPHQLLGMHFFNPVKKMPLVELVHVPGSTCSTVLQQVENLIFKLGKIPLRCRDAPGFVVNRVLAIYLNEAVKLLLEGVDLERIDKVLVRFGMPMGPFRLMDEVGLDVASKVGPVLHQALGDRFSSPALLGEALQRYPEHLGKKTGRGWFVYGKAGGNRVDKVNPVFQKEIAQARKGMKLVKMNDAMVLDRCVLIALQEAVLMLEERVVQDPETLDLGMVLGTGFAPFRGGLLQYVDTRGVAQCVARMEQLAKNDPRFKPHARLVQMAQNNEKFFPNRPDLSKATPVPRPLPYSRL